MIKGAFGAGFAKGFGTTLAEGMKERRQQREKYVDLAIDNAKRVAPAYAQSEAEISTMEDMMQQMNDDFGVTPEEFVEILLAYHPFFQAEKMRQPISDLTVKATLAGEDW